MAAVLVTRSDWQRMRLKNYFFHAQLQRSLHLVSVYLALGAAYSQIAAAGSAICSALAMERLFSPCTRCMICWRNRGHETVVSGSWNFILNVSTEASPAERAFTYADLYAMLGNEIRLRG
jgi:hypothetical protein